MALDSKTGLQKLTENFRHIRNECNITIYFVEDKREEDGNQKRTWNFNLRTSLRVVEELTHIDSTILKKTSMFPKIEKASAM